MPADPLRSYEEAHEELMSGRILRLPSRPPDHEESPLFTPLLGFRSAQTLGPYIAAEAALLANLGHSIDVYGGDPAHRDAMRSRFGHACRDLAVELLHCASSLTFQHYDLPDRLRSLFEAAPLADPADETEGPS